MCLNRHMRSMRVEVPRTGCMGFRKPAVIASFDAMLEFVLAMVPMRASVEEHSDS